MYQRPRDLWEIPGLSWHPVAGFANTSRPPGVDGSLAPGNVLTDPVLWDFESFSGQPAEELRIDVLVRRLRRLFTGFVATHHSITNHRIDIDGDVAQIGAHIRAEHWVAPELAEPGRNCWLAVGLYDDEAVRTADGWRLRRVRMSLTYQENADLFAVALAEAKRILGG